MPNSQQGEKGRSSWVKRIGSLILTFPPGLVKNLTRDLSLHLGSSAQPGDWSLSFTAVLVGGGVLNAEMRPVFPVLPFFLLVSVPALIL